jgi:secreted trypsin-like serine protease
MKFSFSAMATIFVLSQLSLAHAQKPGALVVGGTPVNSTEWIGRRTVALLKNGSLQCSATLISSSVALTAAHCAGGKGFQLAFAVKATGAGVVKRTVTRILVHPSYDPTFRARNPSDIALIFFKGGIPKTHEPVTWITTSQVPTRNSSVTLAGYGSSKRNGVGGYGVLRKATVSVFEASPSDSELILSQKNSSAACYGDSGGPVFMKLSSGDLGQVGIASRVTLRRENGDDVCGNEAIYTRVGFFQKWIREEMNRALETP